MKSIHNDHIFPHVTYSPNGRFLVQETFPKTLPRFVLILISLQRWQHRVRNETKHFVSPHLIGPQFLANQHETNQHKIAALISLFHATSWVLLSVESYQNYRKPTQRGVQGYLSSLQAESTCNFAKYRTLSRYSNATYMYMSVFTDRQAHKQRQTDRHTGRRAKVLCNCDEESQHTCIEMLRS